MRKITLWLVLLAFTCLTAHAEDPITQATAQRMKANFFAFDNGVGQDTWTPEQQAKTLGKLGYAGIGYSGSGNLDERLKAFENQELKVFNLYIGCRLNNEVPFVEEAREAIKRLKGTNVPLWLYVIGKLENDDKAVEAVREIADLAAASDIKVALYPHFGFYIADLDDGLRILRKVNRDNVGLTFNLCHELRAGNEARFNDLLEAAAPHLMFVSINGADHEGDWDKLIQPLGHGTFELKPLLRKIVSIGYKGPIGLQCYAVPGDTLGNLEHNIAQWNTIVDELAGKKP